MPNEGTQTTTSKMHRCPRVRRVETHHYLQQPSTACFVDGVRGDVLSEVTRIGGRTSPALREPNSGRETTTSSSTLAAEEEAHSPVSNCDASSRLTNGAKTFTARRAAKLRQPSALSRTSCCEDDQPVSTSRQETVIAGKRSASDRKGAPLHAAPRRAAGPGAILWRHELLPPHLESNTSNI